MIEAKVKVKKSYWGGSLFLGITFMCFVVPLFIAGDPDEQDFLNLLSPPSPDTPFGTDQLGRDIFLRTLYAGRISLSISFVILCFSLFVGTILGLVAGYKGKTVDVLIMRITDIFLTIPKLVLAMAISFSLGPSLVNLSIAIVLTHWPEYTRLVRSIVIGLRKQPFVEAAKILGVSDTVIVQRHIWPSVLPSLSVRAAMDFSFIIIYVAGLSFLGLGVQPPTSEWGVMVASGRDFLDSAWWVSLFPGLAILLVGLSANLLGEALQDRFAVRAI